MPRVFVIMPFDTDFQSVYGDFLRPVFEDAGFDVKRADDIRGQRNILQDVLEGIQGADLVVADLTGGNENVYYELGLAHGLNKPVILLTQDIDEIPFDLRGYRHVEYDVHFARIEAARARIGEIAKAYLDGELKFGSPVSDFLGRDIRVLPRPTGPSVEISEAEPQEVDDVATEGGFLDHAAAIEEGYVELNAILKEVTEATDEISDLTTQRTAQMGAAKSTAVARSLARKLAEEVSGFSRILGGANTRYRKVAEETENSMEFMISFLRDADTDDLGEREEAISEQVATIRTMRLAAAGGRDAYAGLRDAMSSAPNIERQLTQALASGAAEVDAMVQNIDLTIAAADRALAAVPDSAEPGEGIPDQLDAGEEQDGKGTDAR